MNFSHSTCPVSAELSRLLPDINDISESQIEVILSNYEKDLIYKTQFHLGYPYNLNLDNKCLAKFIDYSINNLGDPFIESNYGVHSRMFEIAVLDWFASLWGLERENYWGYVTSCGTEGNLQGIYMGREMLSDGILYASEDSHYSVFKASRMYKIPLERIKSNTDGTINLHHLRERLIHNSGHPAILNINIGTTLKGGVDDLDQVITLLRESGYNEDTFYIHCDGALVGMMLAFLEQNYISFKEKPISSISVSGHKFIGNCMPCGVILTRRKCINAFAQNVDYINSRDATISGSRNGHSALYMWYTLVKKGFKGIKMDVEKCIANAHYLKQKLIENGIEENTILLNKWSNTVVFKTPICQEFIKKWQLACSGDICHVVVMPNITKEILDIFVNQYCDQEKKKENHGS